MSTTGAITANIDVAQAVLYLFWIFFAGLLLYLHRENKREGYPLQHDRSRGRAVVQGFPAVPTPKTFRLADGTTRTVPRVEATRALQAEPTHVSSGSPLVPLGNPLLAGVGPGTWSQREDVPDTTLDGQPRLQPLRRLPGHGVDHHDPDPRGMAVRGADGVPGGEVVDLWADQSEAIFRYLEVQTTRGRRVLLPMTLARVSANGVAVASILGSQFEDVPITSRPEVVTRREEDRICAYYGAGTLYATPQRAEPLI
jgi:photosynthetic reaction center H subunit